MDTEVSCPVSRKELAEGSDFNNQVLWLGRTKGNSFVLLLSLLETVSWINVVEVEVEAREMP